MRRTKAKLTCTLWRRRFDSSTTRKTDLQDAYGSSLLKLRNGDDIFVVLEGKDQLSQERIGTLKILNDSILSINEMPVSVRRITKIGKRTNAKIAGGSILTGIGIFCLTAGTFFRCQCIKKRNILSYKVIMCYWA